MLGEIETDLPDGKVCIRSPAPVSNDRGCPGVLFEEVEFALDSLPEGDGFEPSVPGDKPWIPSSKGKSIRDELQ